MNTEIIPPGEEYPSNQHGDRMMARNVRISAKEAGETQIALSELIGILRKRRGIIVKTTLVIFALTLIYTLAATRRFRSESTIAFNRENTDSLELDEERAMIGEATAMDYIVTQQTQVKALLSDNLALRVINELNLENTPDFKARQFPPDIFGKADDESALPLERAPHRRERALKVFHKNLDVQPIAGTRLIRIRFLNPDSQLTAKIVNSVVKNYKDQYFENRYNATMESSGWLANQLDDLKAKVAASQQKLVDYQKQAGILGEDESHNIVMTRLEEVNKQLMTAEMNRIIAHTVSQLVRNGNPELVSGLISGSWDAASSMSPFALRHLEELRFQQSEVKLQYAAATTQYGVSNPKLVELKSKIDEIEGTIQGEIRNLAARAENDYVAAQQNEGALRAAFESQKAEANQLNDNAVQYTILKHEVESSRGLYDGLLKKFKEAEVLAGLRTSNILVIDEALPADRPARPMVLLNLGLGLFAGLLCGLGTALVVDNTDDTITTAEDAEEIAKVPVLGVVPEWGLPTGRKGSTAIPRLGLRGGDILVHSNPMSQSAEAFRAIRTSILQTSRKGTSTSILVTSSSPGEGKSVVSLNCAAAFAQQGARVLLVEADMRRPVLKACLNLDRSDGLSSLIKGQSSAPPIRLPSLPNLLELSIIPAGPKSSYPAELLGSMRMKDLVTRWSTEYDYIVFDTPPALTVTDALSLAPLCTLVLLVARSGVTTKKALLRTTALFARLQPRVVGVVLNGLDPRSPEFAGYYGYKNHSNGGAGYYEPLPKSAKTETIHE
jgi:capsular exopolysaccharide synthesis family protein